MAKRHDKAAFQQLMEQLGPNLYKVAKAILKNDDDVADAMQETALTCWEKIDTLKKNELFKTWLTRILINHCNEIYKKRKNLVSDEFIVESGIYDNNFESIEWQEFLSYLDEKYRVILILYYVKGFKTREIADILQLNENTVRSRLTAAREKLEQQYPKRNKSKIIATVLDKNSAHGC